MRQISENLSKEVGERVHSDFLAPVAQGETVELDFNLPYGYEMTVMVSSGKDYDVEDDYYVEIDLFRTNGKLAATTHQPCEEECNLQIQIVEFIENQLSNGTINEKCEPRMASKFMLYVDCAKGDTVESALSVEHIDIESWSLQGIDSHNEQSTLQIIVTTKTPCSEDVLTKEISVKHDDQPFDQSIVDVLIR